MRLTGGTFKNRALKAPKTQTTRPTSEKLRQAVFNILQHRIKGSSFLDLFAGSGAMGLEALSRGAEKATFVENHPEALKTLYANIHSLGLEGSSQVISQSVKKILPKLGTFDIIYVDPPYGADIDHLAGLLSPGGLLLYESNQSVTLTDLTLIEVKSYGDTRLHLFTARQLAE